MTRVRQRMKGMAPDAFTDFQARDLRRTAATRCALLGAPPHVVALVLDHASPDPDVPLVTSVYLRSRYEAEVRDTLNTFGAWIESVARKTKPPALEPLGQD
jgi:integrase